MLNSNPWDEPTLRILNLTSSVTDVSVLFSTDGLMVLFLSQIKAETPSEVSDQTPLCGRLQNEGGMMRNMLRGGCRLHSWSIPWSGWRAAWGVIKDRNREMPEKQEKEERDWKLSPKFSFLGWNFTVRRMKMGQNWPFGLPVCIF